MGELIWASGAKTTFPTKWKQLQANDKVMPKSLLYLCGPCGHVFPHVNADSKKSLLSHASATIPVPMVIGGLINLMAGVLQWLPTWGRCLVSRGKMSHSGNMRAPSKEDKDNQSLSLPLGVGGGNLFLYIYIYICARVFV